MPNWMGRVRESDVFKNLDRLVSLAEEVREEAADDADVLQDIDRIRATCSGLRQRLTGADAALISYRVLTALAPLVQQLLDQLAAYKTDPRAEHIEAASDSADQILQEIPRLPLTTTTADVEGIGDALTTVRRAASQHLRRLGEEVRPFEERLIGMKVEAEALRADVEAQKGRLDLLIAQQQQQFSAAEGERRAEFSGSSQKFRAEFDESEAERDVRVQGALDKSSKLIDELFRVWDADRKTRIEDFEKAQQQRDTTFSELRENYEQTEESRAASFSSAVDNLREQTSTVVEAARADAKAVADRTAASAEALLAELEQLKKQAEHLVGVTGTTGMAGGYQKAANRVSIAATIWNVIAVGALGGLVAFVLYVNLGPGADAANTFSWPRMASRVFVSFTFIALAGYAGLQASRMQELVRRYRRTELELASIDPYLAPLPDEVGQATKKELAPRFFGQQDPVPPPEEHVSASTFKFIEKMVDLVVKRRG